VALWWRYFSLVYFFSSLGHKWTKYITRKGKGKEKKKREGTPTLSMGNDPQGTMVKTCTKEPV
jgi:hypothetical protein